MERPDASRRRTLHSVPKPLLKFQTAYKIHGTPKVFNSDQYETCLAA